MTDCYLLLGSNIGERERNITRAIELLQESLGCEPKKRSTIIQTKSCEFDGNDFLNCTLLFQTEKTPFELLEICKDIEMKMGRRENIEYDQNGRRIYHDRIIDIDILLYGDEMINTKELIIPHPQIKSRAFVMHSLKEIL